MKKGAKLFAFGLGSKLAPYKEIVQVAWKRPLVGWTTLNTDGSAVGNPGKAAVAGYSATVKVLGLKVLRGEWVALLAV